MIAPGRPRDNKLSNRGTFAAPCATQLLTGGGRFELKQFNNGASNPTYFVQTGAGEQFVVRKKPPGEFQKDSRIRG